MDAATKNRQIILVSRPHGMPDPSIFTLREGPLAQPQAGQALARALYFSVDPYMRGRLSDRPSYAPPFALDRPPTGGVVGEVIESKHSGFKPGDKVVGYLEWADYSIA